MSKTNNITLSSPQDCEGDTDESDEHIGITSSSDSDTLNIQKKIKLEDNTNKINSDPNKLDKMNDSATTEKRANFSALNPNLVRIPSLNVKPGTTKKLIIKNFKSKYEQIAANEQTVLSDSYFLLLTLQFCR